MFDEKAKTHLVPAPFPPPFIKNMLLRRAFIPRFSQLLIIVLASISFRFIQKWQDDEKIKSEIEKERISTELSFLKQQVNPHFLFNAINSIYSLSLSGKPSTSDSILKLSSIIRYMLYETDRKFVTLSNEIQIIKDYIELQKLRMTEKVKLTFQVTGESGQYSIAPLLMIPLIENAFKHGVDNISNSFIDINIEIKDDTLNLRIRNSIISRTELNDEKSGIGIKNIVRRLELLYPKAHFFNASRDDGYFLVLLRLALKK
jgi:LytS/YehU family sensor histidine kinase